MVEVLVVSAQSGLGATVHITVQQLKDHILGFVLVGIGFYFGGWIWGNFPTRAGRSMASMVILATFILLMTILYYDLTHGRASQ
jgi:hypothetical protein